MNSKCDKILDLAGLDNTTANGLEGIDGLTKVLKDEKLNFEEAKLLSDKLEAGKRYIKVAYKMHCSDQSECATHCCTFALSKTLTGNGLVTTSIQCPVLSAMTSLQP